jgi:hypothetical protein
MAAAKPTPSKRTPRRRAHLLGLGLDGKDGHKRITQSEKFTILGGSEHTHEAMTETVVKTFETLKRKGKELEEVAPEELKDIIEKNRPKL